MAFFKNEKTINGFAPETILEAQKALTTKAKTPLDRLKNFRDDADVKEGSRLVNDIDLLMKKATASIFASPKSASVKETEATDTYDTAPTMGRQRG